MFVACPPEHRPEDQLSFGDVMSTARWAVIVPLVGHSDGAPAWQK